MRIGVDARLLAGRLTGDRTYWLNLLKGLHTVVRPDDDVILYTRLALPPDCQPSAPRIRVRTVPANNDRLWTMLAFPRALEEDGADIAHTQYTTPLRSPCPIVTTVHDISFRLHPEWFPRKHRLLLSLGVPSAMRRANHVVTDSESSRRDILRIYGLPPDKLTAIPLAAGPEYHPVPREEAQATVRERFGLVDPFFLAVGVLQPRKNLPLLIEAFALALHRAELPHRLVFTGKKGWGCEDLGRQASRLGVSDRLVYTDYVADADLPYLYGACDAMAYPSLYEGFGLPPLEAMACGAPTLVSDAPAMPEVVGDGGWILPVIEPSAWADALITVARDPSVRHDLGARGRRRAACFSWDRTAQGTYDIYRRLAGKQG